MKVISVENVSKKFILAHTRSRNLADAARNVFSRSEREDFWALKDISFEVEQGEALGIIGHNGAGKSTLLKLLTRIMEPTRGRIRTRGRVSALIEIAAGFHPEMTGRENVYLNGSILGMTRKEIDSKFDEIVAFAELEKFIDTPVKRYSSGMYARLGFAVAAHVDPEILLVDEVLSVGDEGFQVKCQERMSRMLGGGATVLFVSHNLPAIVAFCPTTLVLDHGSCAFAGASNEAVQLIRRLQKTSSEADSAAVFTDSSAPVRITNVHVLNSEGVDTQEIETGSKLVIAITGWAVREMHDLNVGIEIDRADGVRCYDVNSGMDSKYFSVPAGEFRISFEVPKCDLIDAMYAVSVGIMDHYEHIHFHTLKRCAHFAVCDNSGYRGIARLGHAWY
jgi:lipopolysaccharide transport system ATP-binding protein